MQTLLLAYLAMLALRTIDIFIQLNDGWTLGPVTDASMFSE